MDGPDLTLRPAGTPKPDPHAPPRQRPWLTRASLAYWMIVVGALGAAVAFWIARTEQRSVSMHRQLTRGQMLELSLRQAIVGDWSFRAALEARQREQNGRVKALQDSATRIRGSEPGLAGQFDMQAQRERLLSYQIDTMLVPFRGAGTGQDVRAKVDQRVTDELARLGFGRSSLQHAASHAADAPPAREDGIEHAPTFEQMVTARELPVWQPFSTEIHTLHHHVPRLALAVVLFVVSLVCLTAADLLCRNARLANAALSLGGLTAGGALVAALTWDLSVWRAMLVALLFAGVLALVFRATGTFKEHTEEGETPHPPEFEPRRFLGVHVTLRHGKHIREQVMLGLVATTVLLSSIVGWWFASAQTHANGATHQAFATEVQLNNLDAERWLESSADLITASQELFHARLRCAYSTQMAALPPEGSSASAIELFTGDRERDCQALATPENKSKAEDLDKADFDTAAHPGSALFSDVRTKGPHNPAALYALADGYITEAELWEGKAVAYVLGLTLFAISLYLLGQAMGMGSGAASTVLAVCGSLLAVVTFGYAVSAYRRPVLPEFTPTAACKAKGRAIEVAAMYYGRGRALYEMATTGEDYARAAEAFACALEARPKFGRAQSDRARAASLISQGDTDSAYSNFPTRDRVSEIRSLQAETLLELEKGHWTPTPRLLNSHGFNTILAALIDRKQSLLDEAIVTLERGIAGSGIGTPDGVIDAVKLKGAPASELDTNQMLYTNLALARLARGNRDGAMKAYQAAVDGLRLLENRELVAGSLSDLNILESHCATLYGPNTPTCGGVATGIKEARRLLLTGRPAAVTRPNPAKIIGPEAWARASRVGWSAELRGFLPASDSLAVVWSEYSEDWQTWRVVQRLLHRVDSKQVSEYTHPRNQSLYISFPSYCLPEGRYRAEFFLNGERVETEKSIEMDVRGFRDYRSREMDVALCVPANWTRSSRRDAGENRYLMQAFSTPKTATADARAALYLFTFFTSREGNQFEPQAIERAWTLMKRLSTSAPNDEGFYTALNRFQGCDKPVEPNTLLSRVWRTADGLVHVAFVVGNAAPGGQACEVLESIGSYYARDNQQVLRPR